MGGSRREPGRPRRFVPHALKNRIPAFSTGGGLNVRYWPCAPKARTISRGGFYPESCRLVR
jgi:hypothetical protein